MNPAPSSSPCTCFRARKLARLLSLQYDRRLSQAGLNVNQFSILRHVGQQPRTVSELARALGMDRTTLSRDLKPLLGAGWLEGIAGSDSRQRPVRRTAAGHRVVRQAAPLWQAAQDDMDRLLGGKHVARLHAQLDRAIERLGSARDEQTANRVSKGAIRS